MFRPLLFPREGAHDTPDFFQRMQFPLWGSPKIDGIRGITLNKNIVYSRTGKPLPSFQVQEEFGELLYMDGEIVEGSPYSIDVYNRSQSYVMSQFKPGNIHYHVFDTISPEALKLPYYKRYEILEKYVEALRFPRLHLLPQRELNSLDELFEFEAEQVGLGAEGIMLRSPVSFYKNGRATLREGTCYKVKRFEDREGFIKGFVERLINNNPQEKNELGYAKRSHSKENKIPADTLGAFIVSDGSEGGEEFPVGTGTFTDAQLKEIWDNRSKYLNKILKYNVFNHGVKDRPRHPRAIGFRDISDM